MLSNPPFGVSWVKEENFIRNEANDPHGRFTAGTPRTSDGALLFLQHMISKMEANGSRIAIMFNGSPLRFQLAKEQGRTQLTRRKLRVNAYLENRPYGIEKFIPLLQGP